MSAPVHIGVEGIGVWSVEMPNWDVGRDVLCGKMDNVVATAGSRPAPSLLAPTERRRAQRAVLVAIDAAQQACAMAGRDPRELPNVFASAYGDLEISDYLCATLACEPNDMSPTKFHNSVHNAPAGYWSIATGCMASSTALSAGAATFGAGLLEAALLAQSESCAVLLTAYDIAAVGALADLVPSRAAFAVALVLAPTSRRAIARLLMQPEYSAVDLAPETGVLHASYQGNPAAHSLPLLMALAQRTPATQSLAAGAALNLRMEILF